MADYYDASQKAIIDRDNRQMALANFPMSQELEDLRQQVSAGNIGITADAQDVDSLALGGGSFRWDKDTAPGTSLLFGWKSGRIQRGATTLTVAAGSLTLAASSTNYIEVDNAGTVSSNTTSFTAGKLPLYVVTTGPGGYSANSVVSAKPLLCLIGPRGVNGAMLSAVASTKEILFSWTNDVAANTTFLIPSPNAAATLLAIVMANTAAIATSDSDYWQLDAVNLGPSGSGTTAVTGSSTTNSTKATGGSAIAAGVARSFALTATDADKVTAANDVIAITLTKNGSPANLTGLTFRLDFTFDT